MLNLPDTPQSGPCQWLGCAVLVCHPLNRHELLSGDLHTNYQIQVLQERSGCGDGFVVKPPRFQFLASLARELVKVGENGMRESFL